MGTEPSTVTSLESFTTVTRDMGHPSDFNLLPIKEFYIFLIKEKKLYTSINYILVVFLKLRYRKEERPNYK